MDSNVNDAVLQCIVCSWNSISIKCEKSSRLFILTDISLLSELVEALRDQRMPDGTTENVGQVLVDWVSVLVVSQLPFFSYNHQINSCQF